MRQNDGLVQEEASSRDDVVEMDVLVDGGAVSVLRQQERALEQKDLCGEELRRGLEDSGAAIARVGQEGDLLAPRDVGTPAAQSRNLLPRPAGKLFPKLLPDLREEVADRRARGDGRAGS